MCVRFLQTLGHLEKAVVLELTLKHVKALTSLLEQQQQKILALQNGVQIGEPQVARARRTRRLCQNARNRRADAANVKRWNY